MRIYRSILRVPFVDALPLTDRSITHGEITLEGIAEPVIIIETTHSLGATVGLKPYV